MSQSPTDNSLSQKNNLPISLLKNCAKNADENNAKLAQKTIENAQTNNIDKAMKQMVEDCFKDPKTGRRLTYAEMRMFYG